MSQVIRPTNPAAVRINPGQAGMGDHGMQPQAQPMEMQRQISPGEGLTSMLSRAMGSTGRGGSGGFNWSAYDNNLYEDEGLRKIKEGGPKDNDSISYLLDRVASAVQEYVKQIFHRQGMFFAEFNKAKEAFRFNEATALPCPIRDAFITEVNKRYEFVRLVAINGAPFFGRRLMYVLEETRKDNLTPEDYLEAAHIASRNVLFLEMINWLTNSKKGRSFTNNLSQELETKLSNLENYKEVAAGVYEIFNTPNPYGNLEFKKYTVTRPDNLEYRENVTNFVVGESGMMSAGNPRSEELEEFIRRQVKATNRGGCQQQSTQTNYQDSVVVSGMNWQGARKDFENLTKDNKHEFNLNRFFRPIGKPNYYLIPESDWEQIKKAFTKHPEMGREESVLPGCFRVVIMNLEDEGTGWFSLIVRKEGLDLATVLSNPAILLPDLEDLDAIASDNLKMLEAEKINLEHVELEEITRLERKTPVITVNEIVEVNSSKELEDTANLLNDKLIKDTRTEVAVATKFSLKEPLILKVEEDKDFLRVNLPELFKITEEDKSILEIYSKIKGVFSENILDNGVMSVINRILTDDFNNWLINACGYNHPTQGEGFLNVGSILADHVDLYHVLKKTNPTLSHYLNGPSKNASYLRRRLKLFLEGCKVPVGETSLVEAARQSKELTLEREFFMVTVSNRYGPSPGASYKPLIIKRSRFPEIFEMVERGFSELYGDSCDINSVDKIIKFSEDGQMWLANFSLLDDNVISLRRISREDTLIKLKQV